MSIKQRFYLTLDAFKKRKPWASVIIAVLNPWLAFCYLNKGWLAATYLITVTIILELAFIPKFGISYAESLIFSLIVHIIAITKCYYVACKYSFSDQIKWYARFRNLVLLWLGALLFFGLLAIGTRAFLYEPFTIPSYSMSPNINGGDYIFADKAAYGYSHYSIPFNLASFNGRILTGGHLPQRGDIVVFKLPSNTSVDYIKRIVGLPGDIVEIKKGILIINSHKTQYIPKGNYVLKTKKGTQSFLQYLEILPEGPQYNILRESENSSEDMLPVTVPSEHYFVLGDNRDNSQDSRDKEHVGFVPLVNIIGRLIKIKLF